MQREGILRSLFRRYDDNPGAIVSLGLTLAIVCMVGAAISDAVNSQPISLAENVQGESRPR